MKIRKCSQNLSLSQELISAKSYFEQCGSQNDSFYPRKLLYKVLECNEIFLYNVTTVHSFFYEHQG